MAFKLFDSFEGLLEREIILTDLEKKQVELIVGLVPTSRRCSASSRLKNPSRHRQERAPFAGAVAGYGASTNASAARRSRV